MAAFQCIAAIFTRHRHTHTHGLLMHRHPFEHLLYQGERSVVSVTARATTCILEKRGLLFLEYDMASHGRGALFTI